MGHIRMEEQTSASIKIAESNCCDLRNLRGDAALSSLAYRLAPAITVSLQPFRPNALYLRETTRSPVFTLSNEVTRIR